MYWMRTHNVSVQTQHKLPCILILYILQAMSLGDGLK